MINVLKQLFRSAPEVNFSDLKKKGAVILDVRSREEYQRGHIKGSIHIPLNHLPNELSKLKKEKPIITVCASGMRSASAENILKSNGFKEVYNGGGWMSLQSRID